MNKQILKKLRDIANRLPLTYEKGNKYTKGEIKDLRGKEIKNTQFFQPGEGLIMMETKPIPIIKKNQTLYPVNHYRRLKKAYEKDGANGVKEYYKWVDQNNKKLNAEFETKLVTDVVANITKERIKEFMV